MLKNKLPETFCIAPFVNGMIDRDGAMLPCCEYMPENVQPRETLTRVGNIDRWWKIDLEPLRQDLVHGRENPGCSHCYAQERNPETQTQRQILNTRYFGTGRTKQIEDYLAGNSPEMAIDYLEIRVSNYCNLKCIMCGSYASSSIAQEYQTHASAYKTINLEQDIVPTIRWWDDVANNKELQHILPQLVTVDFSGGEPLLVPEVADILNQFIPNRMKYIGINTNLTKLSKKFIAAFNRFSNLCIRVSLEGVGAMNDYVRSGSIWATIDKNFQTLKESCPQVRVQISHTLQHTSVFSLPALLEYADTNNLIVNTQEVYYGSYPSPGVLTINSAHPNDVAKFSTWLDTYTGPNRNELINWVGNYHYDPELNKKFHEYVTMLDSIRNTNFKNTFNPTYEY